jgi:hypothetical protein
MIPGNLVKIISKITGETQIGMCLDSNLIKLETHYGSSYGFRILTSEGNLVFPQSHWNFEIL